MRLTATGSYRIFTCFPGQSFIKIIHSWHFVNIISDLSKNPVFLLLHLFFFLFLWEKFQFLHNLYQKFIISRMFITQECRSDLNQRQFRGLKKSILSCIIEKEDQIEK